MKQFLQDAARSIKSGVNVYIMSSLVLYAAYHEGALTVMQAVILGIIVFALDLPITIRSVRESARINQHAKESAQQYLREVLRELRA